MFNALRKSIANFINPAQVIINVPAGTTSLTYHAPAKHLTEQVSNTQQYVGQFHVSHLELLSSDYLRNAIAQLGAWSCLARAFSQYEKVVGQKRGDMSAFETLVEEFHCWNSAISEAKQMDDEAIALAADKISVVRPPKGSKETDAIIARIRKCTVAELKAQREEKAAKASAARTELLTGFCQTLGHWSGSDMDPSISNAKAAAKAVQTIEWLASQDWSPEFVAGECLLIEADLATLERNARREEARGDGGTFVDGTLTSDGMVRNALAQPNRKFGDERQDKEGILNPVLSAEDAAAFAAWQQEQRAA